MAINKESRWGNAEGKTSTIVRHAFHEILILFVPISSLLSFKMIAWDTGGCASSVWNGSILKPFVFELENSGRRDMRWPLQYKQADNSALDGLICQHSGELCSSWDRVCNNHLHRPPRHVLGNCFCAEGQEQTIQAQEQSRRKPSTGVESLQVWIRSSWLNWSKKGNHTKVAAGSEQSEDRDIVWACRTRIRKGKAHLELNLGRSCLRHDPAMLEGKGSLGKIEGFCRWAWVTEVM